MNTEIKWRVPRNRISEFHRKIQPELIEALQEVFVTDPLSLVNIIHDCEDQFAQWIGLPYAVGVNSGTMALVIGLLGLGVCPGDEVITVANSDMADTNSIAAVGATAVLCDVRETDYTLDPEKLETLINDRTKVILPVDLYGNPANIVEIRKIADRHGLFILQDAALGAFSEDHGKKAGYYADAVAFSASATKFFHGLGYGGFVCTKNAQTARRCHLFTEYGVDYAMENGDPYAGVKYHCENGLNVKMNAADAAAIRCKFHYFDGFKQARRQVLTWYEEYLGTIPGIALPGFRQESHPCVRELAIRVVSDQSGPALRNKLLSVLWEKGIQGSIGFTPCVHKRLIGKKHIWPGSERLPVSEMLDDRILTLPCDVTTTEEDVKFITSVIDRFMRSAQN